MRLHWIKLDRIDLDPNQPRKDVGDITDLAASIKERGVVQPLIVEEGEDRRYRLIAGERRYRASHEAGLNEVPCVVRTIQEHERVELQLVENLHRKDINPIEEAESYQRLMAEFNYDQPKLAKHLGKSTSSINEMMQLLLLPQTIRQEMAATKRDISKSLLIEIARHEDPELQRELWDKAQKGELTVRKARQAKRPAPDSSSTTSKSGATSSPLPKQAYSTKHNVTVIIQSKGEELTPEQILGGLEEALETARTSLTSENSAQ